MGRRRASIRSLLGLFLLAAAARPVAAQDPVTRISIDANGAEGDSYSGWGRSPISADGRYVAFESLATNLVPGDTNGFTDVFVHDRVTGAIVRVNVSTTGAQSDDSQQTNSLAISGDGRFVAFANRADNLVAGDTNGDIDVFLHDRDPDENGIFDEGFGATTRVSVDSNGNEADQHSLGPSLSADGRFIAFWSYADGLVAGDTNRAADVFLHDRVTGATTRVSVSSTGAEALGASYEPSISADGRFVAFSSRAYNLVSGDTNDLFDVFVRDLVTGQNERDSVSSTGVEGDDDSSPYSRPLLSADGNVVAFFSYATNLVSGDTNGKADVFLRDRTTGATTRVSVDSTGQQGDADSFAPWLSADGSVVAFASDAGNLIAGDTNLCRDVFLHDRASGATTLASATCAGTGGNHPSDMPVLSDDSLLVVFVGSSDDLVAGDTNQTSDVFVLDRTVGEVDASWTSYGAGFPGTLGIPTLTASADPAFGASIAIDASNSYGPATPGLLLVGLARASIPMNGSGTILVDFLLLVPLPIPSGGASLAATIPADPDLCGLAIDLQVLELDPGAARGISFTPGLELVIGH